MSKSWEDNLGVTFCPKGSTLEKGFPEPNTLGVDEEPSLDVVDGVDGKIKTFPKLIIEEALCFRCDPVLVGDDFEVLIENLGCVGCALCLRLADVIRPKQELSVEVRDLNIVVVRDCDKTVRARSESDECEELEELTPESASSYQEGFDVPELLVEAGSEYGDDVVVPGTESDSFDILSLWKGFESFIVEPLPNGGEFASKLDYLLGDDSTPEGAQR